MSDYKFKIEGIGNGWVLGGIDYGRERYFGTLNKLVAYILEMVDSDAFDHRKTGKGEWRKRNKRELEKE